MIVINRHILYYSDFLFSVVPFWGVLNHLLCNDKNPYRQQVNITATDNNDNNNRVQCYLCLLLSSAILSDPLLP